MFSGKNTSIYRNTKYKINKKKHIRNNIRVLEI